MTNNTSTFTPSTQILEAGEKAQALADAGKTLKPFLPQEAQQAVEGVDRVAQAFTATGRVLEHFGFDEAESIDSIPVEDIDPGFMGSVIEPYSQSILESPCAPPVTLLPSIDLNPALV